MGIPTTVRAKKAAARNHAKADQTPTKTNQTRLNRPMIEEHRPKPEGPQEKSLAEWEWVRKSPLARLSRYRYTSSVKVSEVLKRIAADGWVLVRTKGSHRQFKHPTKPGLVTVAGLPSEDVDRGTLNSIMKQSGLKE